MCISPGKLPSGQEFPCRKCWQCHEQRVDDWVGRCLAESKTSVTAHSITLTYGRDEAGNEDHFRAAWLTYSDVQKMFKHLRIDGYRFRYLVAGEYGSMKGRAHWHLLIFWQGKVPPHELTTSRVQEKRFQNKYWPHGFQHWEKPNARSIRYVCKYIQKDMGKDERQGHLSMSKKPPLGALHFANLAQQYVDQGLAPQSYEYRFSDVLAKDGKPKSFYMRGTTARNFVEAYKAKWKERHGNRHHPNSTLIEDHEDRITRQEWMPETDHWGQRPPQLEGGTEPVLGRYPPTNEQALHSDLFGFRWYYLKREEEYAWLKGERVGRIEPLIRTRHTGPNRYEQAKRQTGEE